MSNIAPSLFYFIVTRVHLKRGRTNSGSISDLKLGPDNSLYVLTPAQDLDSASPHDAGSLYRISQNTVYILISSKSAIADYTWLIGTAIVLLVVFMYLRYSIRIRIRLE